jgi:hypothetical protein
VRYYPSYRALTFALLAAAAPASADCEKCVYALDCNYYDSCILIVSCQSLGPPAREECVVDFDGCYTFGRSCLFADATTRDAPARSFTSTATSRELPAPL